MNSKILIIITSFLFVVLSLVLLPGFFEQLQNAFFLGQKESKDILINFRLSRLLLAFIAGSSLGLIGLIFQTLYNNELASPHTLGVSAASSLGASVSIYYGLSSTLFHTGFFSFLGALVGVLIIMLFAKVIKRQDSSSLLLVGISLSFLFSSLIIFFQFTSTSDVSLRIMHWLIGSISTYGFSDVVFILPFLCLCIFVSIFFSKKLDVIGTNSEMAYLVGINVKRIEYVLFFLCSMLLAAVVSVCGPITFVGIICPHLVKSLIPYGHKNYIFYVVLISGSFLCFCDTLSRIFIYPSELPIGVITSILGVPFFIFFYLKKFD